MTEPEARRWYFLRAARFRGLEFRRQMPLPSDSWIFAAWRKAGLADWTVASRCKKQSADEQRTTYLQSKGFTVLRFWNNDVPVQTAAVPERIRIEIEGQSLSLSPLPEGEGTA